MYLYLINYAKTQPELTLLAVNTFVKDANDPNPLIRALAVRTMGCIRVEKITEYLCEPLRKSLRDDVSEEAAFLVLLGGLVWTCRQTVRACERPWVQALRMKGTGRGTGSGTGSEEGAAAAAASFGGVIRTFYSEPFQNFYHLVVRHVRDEHKGRAYAVFGGEARRGCSLMSRRSRCSARYRPIG